MRLGLVKQLRLASAVVLASLLAVGASPGRAADEAPAERDPDASGTPLGFERTPPRLAYADGSVSFFRPGASDWTRAELNTPLAPGDRLSTEHGSNLELQVGPRAFLRAGEDTELGLDNLEPDFLQFRITSGTLSVDARSLRAGQTIEISTPNAAFSIERSGYYRVEVDGDTTTFASRRGGNADVTPAGGEAAVVAASEQAVVEGSDTPTVETYAAPPLDAWDRWNYERTDDQLDARSARYVPPEVYGADDLDRHGRWRVVPTYGPVWVPAGVPSGWAPYTTGRWIYDPYYGWTWVDEAPWGWAPYHYGRWVYVSSTWAWAPGPVVVHAVYAPALVAFFDRPRVSVGVSVNVGFRFGSAGFGWVALGWGEPIVPWWGPRGCVGVPRWAGWGGPRVVNNVVVHQKIVNVNEIRLYQNVNVRGAVVAVPGKEFGRGRGERVRLEEKDIAKLAPMRGALPVQPAPESLAPGRGVGRGKRPSEEILARPVVATREPRVQAPTALAEEPRGSERRARGRDDSDAAAQRPPDRVTGGAEPPARAAEAPTRIVKPPRDTGPDGRRTEVSSRPPFGRDGAPESAPVPAPPRFEDVARREAAPQTERSDRGRTEPAAPAPESRRRGARAERAPEPAPPRVEEQARKAREAPPEPAGNLPGEPADRVFRGRRGATPDGVDVAPRGRADRAPASPGPAAANPSGGTSDSPQPKRGGGKKQGHQP